MTQQPDPAARPAVFVLFGATGDLARRMVLPAVYRLACGGLLPLQWLLVGNGRGDITHENFCAHVHDALTQFGPSPRKRTGTHSRSGCSSPAAGSAPAACRTCSARRAHR